MKFYRQTSTREAHILPGFAFKRKDPAHFALNLVFLCLHNSTLIGVDLKQFYIKISIDLTKSSV